MLLRGIIAKVAEDRAPLQYGERSDEDFGAAYFSKYGVGWYGYHVKRYQLFYAQRLDSYVH